MSIRSITLAVALVSAWALLAPEQAPSSSYEKGRKVAITIDDLPTASVTGNDIETAERVTRDLIAALRRQKAAAIGFVNERKLQPDGKLDPRRVALLQQWLDAGLELGNHTFSHPDLHRTPLDEFQRDVLAGERVTRKLVSAAGKELRFFRHPFLHTGQSIDVKHSLEAFLQRHGYRVAPVTVDNYDYMFAAAYDRAGTRGDIGEQQKIVSTYLDYMESVVGYYEQQSVTIVGREMAQTLLLHANAMNAATFDALAARLVARGYGFVTLEEALRDPAYSLPDTYVGAGGITWLHRWALTQGKRGAVFAGEPIVPDWIERAAR
jgi:peptidoglycan/xylan/chitin deacetylase (PgdA/CDA1 family)